MSSEPARLAPSELGTKEYWDALYATELANHAGNPADTGTVWFDDADAEAKMVTHLGDALAGDEGDAAGSAAPRAGLRILDLGCGNGSLLRAVREELGERGAASGACLLGVDYSEASIALARQVTADADATADAAESADAPIDFAVWDVLHGDAAALGRPAGAWDVVLDKGTFDAISLGHGQAAGTQSTVEALYRRQVVRLLRRGGRFLITSCNWTEPELVAWMTAAVAGETARLVQTGRVAYPRFQFGGVQGQTVCTVCFTKTEAGQVL